MPAHLDVAATVCFHVGVELDGLEVRYPAGDTETVVPWSASRPDRVTPAEIEVTA